MIEARGLSLWYGDRKVISDSDFDIPSGSLALLAGPTGCGKSTLLGSFAGLVPNFTGGAASGEVRMSFTEGSDPVVAFVPQSPADGFIANDVAHEVCFGLEHLPLQQRLARMEAALAAVGASQLRDRRLHELSRGEAQRVAIATALAREPDLLLLDEPTSALDPVAADEVLHLLHRLTKDHGITVLFSEHRFDQAVGICDTLLVIDDGRVRGGSMRELSAALPQPPALHRLASAVGLDPLPLNLAELRSRTVVEAPVAADAASLPHGAPVVKAANLRVSLGGNPVLRGVSIEVRAGEVCGVFGRNGAGKSTLLHTLFGDFDASGRIDVGGADPRRLNGHDLLRRVAIVPQEPLDLLVDETIGDFFAGNDERRRLTAGSTEGQALRLGLRAENSAHPRDLSEGQRLLAALAASSVGEREVLLLDEPTRGLDQSLRGQLAELLRDLADGGLAVLVATHDLDWAAELVDSAVLLADGRVADAGSAREVLTASRLTSPTAARATWPHPRLRLAEAAAALRVRP